VATKVRVRMAVSKQAAQKFDKEKIESQEAK
jgi:hypothetical protein